METQHKQHESENRPSSEDRSIGGLVRELMLEMISLVRNEAALARAEISDNVSKLQGGIASMVLAIVLLLVGLIGLMEAGIYGLALVWPFWLSALVIGGGIVVVGLIALAIGWSAMRTRNLKLDRSTGELRKDAEFAREHAS